MEVEEGAANTVFAGVDRVTPLIRGAADFTSTAPSVGQVVEVTGVANGCLLYTSPSPRDATLSRMPSSA